MSDGPARRYQAAIDSNEIHYDAAQLVAVQELQRVFDEINQPREVPGLLSRLLGRRSERNPGNGLYLWGGVGRGKTYLMDVFFDCLPTSKKTRLHFHRFMRLVHQRLQQVQGESNPLKKVAASFANEAEVICFDEFFVSDITDAMILAYLLEELFQRGVLLVATSNVEPRNLYKNGLQRRKFLPAIELIYQHTQVVNVDGDRDYRLRALQSAEIYHSPLDQAATENLHKSFAAIAPDAGRPDVVLEIENRSVKTLQCADGVVWFGFVELCGGPRSQNDYIELARLFQTVLVSNLPQLDGNMDSEARRFISLVDEFYDRNVKLILSAAVPINDLYVGNLLTFEFQRTASRLVEMQTMEYLSREHRP